MIKRWVESLKKRYRLNGSHWSRLTLVPFSLGCIHLLSACNSAGEVEAVPFDDLLVALGPAKGVLSVIAILAGVMLLVAGWKIYRFVVALPGFLIGAALGVWLSHELVGDWRLALLGFAAGGLIGIWLVKVVHNFALFVVGAVGGVYLLNSLWGMFFETSPTLWVVIVSGLIGGVVLFALSRHWMVFLSSVVGAMMVVWGIQGDVSLIIALFLVGIVLQYGISRAFGEKAFTKVGKPT